MPRLDLSALRIAFRNKVLSATGAVETYTSTTGTLAAAGASYIYTDAGKFATYRLVPGVNDYILLNNPAGTPQLFHISYVGVGSMTLDAWSLPLGVTPGSVVASSAINLLEASQWAWEGDEFTPPSVPPTSFFPRAGLWVQEKLMVADESQVTNSLYGASGIYQLNVFAPKGRGTVAVDAVAATLTDLWNAPNNLPIIGAVDVQVDKATRGNIINRPDGWDFEPVRMYWRAYTPKNNTAAVTDAQDFAQAGSDLPSHPNADEIWFTFDRPVASANATVAGLQVSADNVTWYSPIAGTAQVGTSSGKQVLITYFDPTGALAAAGAQFWRTRDVSGVAFTPAAAINNDSGYVHP